MRATPLPAFKQARRDLNPQPPVLETGALPVELRTYDIHAFVNVPSYSRPTVLCPLHSGQGRNRTTDTTIFSRVLYQLSYLARYLVLHCTRHSARYLDRYLPVAGPVTWTEKKSARPFGDGRLGEGCTLSVF